MKWTSLLELKPASGSRDSKMGAELDRAGTVFKDAPWELQFSHIKGLFKYLNPQQRKRTLDKILRSIPSNLILEVLTSCLEKLDPEDRVALRMASPVTVPIDYGNGELKIVCDSPVELSMRARPKHKEPELVEWIEATVRRGDVFYDIGANIGAYSLIAASVAEGGAQVVAIEPSLMNFERLARNIMLNKLEKRITPIPVAMTDRTGLDRLTMSSLTEGAAFNFLQRFTDGHALSSEVASKVGDGSRSIGTLAMSLDDLIGTFDLPVPTLLKIDIDGFENQLFEGATRTFENPRVRGVFIELSRDENLELVSQKLGSFGFQKTLEFVRGERSFNQAWMRESR